MSTATTSSASSKVPIVHFSDAVGPTGYLSNFALFAFFIDGVRYPSTEHYFQAIKFAGTDKERMIREAATPEKAKELGGQRDAKFPLRKDWDGVKDEVMFRCNLEKFRQNPSIAQQLLATGTAPIAERSDDDAYWGDGSDRKGQNKLGEILMRVRHELANEKRIAVVVGVGPGLGVAVAQRFARAGFHVALVARDASHLASLEKDVAKVSTVSGGVLSVSADCSQLDSVRKAFAEIKSKLGHPSVLVYNASGFTGGSALDIKAEKVDEAWRISALSALVAAQEVLPNMVLRKRGTILLTGATASLRGGARFAGFAMPKFALRALGQSLAREFGPQFVHVAHIIVDGQIYRTRASQGQPTRAVDSFLDPDAIAETYWQLHSQPISCWAQELDLRPSVERF